MKKNLLIKGENLDGLIYLRDTCQLRGKIDLVYIDPPFATGGIYKSDANGRTATISCSGSGTVAYSDTLKGEAYLHFLAERIKIIHELLSPRGSLYLHIDYKIGHYVKVLVDTIFGAECFRNDITRIKCNPKNFSRIGFGNIKDMVLFYTKSENPIWNEPRLAFSTEELLRLYPKIDANGRRYTTNPLHAPGETKNGASNKPFKGINPPAGRHWRYSIEELERLDEEGLIEWSENGNPRKIIYADERIGKKMQDIWEYKDHPYPQYPTEKNHDMLEMIVQASSLENSIVLDCFAGSGGTLTAAGDLHRKWIGIDNSPIAIDTIRQALKTKPKGRYFNYDYLELS